MGITKMKAFDNANWSIIFILACLAGVIIMSHNDESFMTKTSEREDINSRIRREVLPNVTEATDSNGRIEFEELYNGTYSYSRFSETWSPKHRDYYYKSDDSSIPSI